MTIYDSNNQAVLTVEVSDESYAYNEIMGDKRLHLEFELPNFVEIPVGSYVTFHNETYYLLKPESLRLVHRRNWEYVIEFEGVQEILSTLVYQNPDNHCVEFPVTGDVNDHLTILARCINGKDTRTWNIRNPQTEPYPDELKIDKCINYSFNNCKEALQAIADTFETEWEIILVNGSPKIWVGKVEHNKNAPLEMSYGKGNGLRPGIERKNYNDEMPLTTIYVKGDDRNISYYVDANGDDVSYGSKTLHLPTSATGGYDGTYFSWENNNNYDSENAMLFAVSSDGFSVSDSGAISRGERNEGILDCTDIYPKYEGTVTRVDAVDVSKNLYDFYDNAQGCPNFKNLGTPETMTVIFQNGMLAGREFDVNPQGSSTYGMKYEIVPAEQDGIPMPGGSFVPVANETKYIIFHCKLPYQYINDPTTHTGAEWDMLKTAVKYLWEARMPRYSISGELDPIWSNASWATVGDKIKCGGYISFTDPSFQTDPFLIRIQSVKHFVNKQFKPVITLANTPTKSSVASQIRSIERDNFGNELQINDSRQFTKRTFASAKATMDALAEFFEDYSDAIKPIGIQTMQMIVGDERLQTEFSRNASDFLPKIAPPVYWDAGLVCGSGTKAYVRNQNIDDDCEIITTISGAHEHYQWPCKSETLTTDAYGNVLVDNKQYYLYLYATKNNNGNNSTAWKLFPVGEANSVLDFYDSARGQYNFFVGILNMMEDETRQFVPVCGFTEITPGGITTSRIQDPNANSWLDLATGEFSWGNGAITYNPTTNQTTYTGQVTIGAGSTGLSNLEGYNNLANKTDISDLQLQVDGKINTYHQDTNPATWPSEDNPKHVGDLWSDSNNNNIIKRYRYYSNNNTYGWESLRDEDIPNALALASAKRRVFTTTPNPAYDVNDLWINGGKLYVCINAKAEGESYSGADWQQGLFFDVDDRLQVQREWERIHGANNTDGSATMNGSYLLTRTYLHGLQEPAKLVYKVSGSDKVLTYNNNALVYNVTGSSALDTAYGNLKGYLNDHELYDEDTTWDSGSDELTALFLAYYKEEKTFELSNISDFEYLKKAMPDGASTDIGRGVVLSSLIAVRDASGSVKAGMNGTSAFNDLMLWAGSDNASSIESAKWRVFKNGAQKNGTEGGAMIELRPSESLINISDSTGTPTIVIDGLSHSINDLFPSGTIPAITLSTLNASGSQDEDGAYAEEITDSQTSITTSYPGVLEFPNITLTASVLGQGTGSVTPTSTYVTLDVDGGVIATAGSSTQTATTVITGVKHYLTAGTHTITLTASFEGQCTDGVSFSATASYSTSSATLVTEQKMSYLCANGFILGASSTNYFISEVETVNDSSVLNFLARSGNAGIGVNNGQVKWWDSSTSSWKQIYSDGGILKIQ